MAITELENLELEIKENELEVDKLYQQIHNINIKIRSINKRTNKLIEKRLKLLTDGLSRLQVFLMKHTIEDNNKNWFGVDFNSKEESEFENLVESGYAKKLSTPDWMDYDQLYGLTEKGIDLIKKINRTTTSKLIYELKDGK